MIHPVPAGEVAAVPATAQARISVVVPTYNRRDLLRQTLESLAGQQLPADQFEVIVADDGSSDGSAEVARSFSGRLRLRYHFQEDRGFRVAAARNAGARLATAPVLAFLDTGTVAGPGFTGGHLAAHGAGPGGPPGEQAVIGYCYGYRPFDSRDWLTEAIATLGLVGAVQRHGGAPGLADARHAEFERARFDPGRMAAPWFFFWSMNCSVTARAFWAAGGFDESYRSWGTEDTELGYRLFRRGTRFGLSREAWSLELPHVRQEKGNRHSLMRNARYFLRKHPDPIVEITRDAFGYPDLGLVESGAATLAGWARRARDLDVVPELEKAAQDIPPVSKVAVFGCGRAVPAALPPCVLADFDQELLEMALSDRRHTGWHAIGLRTPLAAQSADVVVLTSRLEGIWGRWGDRLTAEAQRVGRQVVGPFPGLGRRPPVCPPLDREAAGSAGLEHLDDRGGELRRVRQQRDVELG
jgi:GT2 family glycosyltransferase